MPRLAASAILLAGALLLPACASHETKEFDAAWKQPSSLVTTDPSVSIAGKWEGTWQSNGYDYFNGLCRAIVTPADVSDEVAQAHGQHYRINVKIFYFNIFPRDFSFILTAAPGQNEKTSLTGEKDFGAEHDGVWKFEGDAEGRALFLSFTSVKDYGTVTLRRYPAPN